VKKYRILLVDDEQHVLTFLCAKLKVTGYEVTSTANSTEAIEQLKANDPDLVVLDIMMPEMDGFEVLTNLRQFSAVPVIILSARDANIDKIKGLDLGADDYLSKPFHPDELVSRIEAIRRRFVPLEERIALDVLSLGDLTIDFKKRLVYSNGEKINLTRIEWLLLQDLVHNTGSIRLYEDILISIWGPEYRSDIQILRTWISRLRLKMSKNSKQGLQIRTIPKAGYILDE